MFVIISEYDPCHNIPFKLDYYFIPIDPPLMANRIMQKWGYLEIE